MILDEVQRAPQLFSYLQTKTDLDREMGQYILSGSQNFLLLESITQSLAGRVALFKLMPFSFSEMQAGGLLANTWEEACFQGFYPAIFDRQIHPIQFYPNYLETYLERDVRNLISVKDLSQFRLFIKRCAGNAGQLLNLQSLATDCGISQPTAKSWLSVLESSYIVFLLPPYYKNFNKRIIKTPKLFFYDTGLICNLLEMDNPNDVDKYFQRGSLFENFIIAEMHKQLLHLGRRPAFYFWQDANRNEIDLLWEKVSEIHCMEIKSGQTVSIDFFKNLYLFSSLSNSPNGKNYVAYGGDQQFTHQGVEVLNWQAVQNLM